MVRAGTVATVAGGLSSTPGTSRQPDAAGFNFSGPVVYEGSMVEKSQFHNTGLYSEDERGAYPEPNTGLYRHNFATDYSDHGSRKNDDLDSDQDV